MRRLCAQEEGMDLQQTASSSFLTPFVPFVMLQHHDFSPFYHLFPPGHYFKQCILQLRVGCALTETMLASDELDSHHIPFSALLLFHRSAFSLLHSA